MSDEDASNSLQYNLNHMGSPTPNPEAALFHQPQAGSVPCLRKSEFLKKQSHTPAGKKGILQQGTEKVIASPSQDDEETACLGHLHACELKGDMTAAPSRSPAVLAFTQKILQPAHNRASQWEKDAHLPGRHPKSACICTGYGVVRYLIPMEAQTRSPQRSSQCSILPNVYSHHRGDAALETEI